MTIKCAFIMAQYRLKQFVKNLWFKLFPKKKTFPDVPAELPKTKIKHQHPRKLMRFLRKTTRR